MLKIDTCHRIPPRLTVVLIRAMMAYRLAMVVSLSRGLRKPASPSLRMLQASMVAATRPLVVALAWDSWSATFPSPGRLPHRRPAP
jgi:hypothetical protein